MNEHNPIAMELGKIRAKWMSAVPAKPGTKLIRFLIRPEEARVYEGFCKLESSQHGYLPEVFITQLTSFESAETFSRDLIRDWLEAYRKDEKTREALAHTIPSFSWNPQPWQQVIDQYPDGNHDDTLLQLLNSFRAALPGDDPQLVFVLLPRQVSSTADLGRWCCTLLKKGVPQAVRFLLVDHLERPHFDEPFARFQEQSLTLAVPLQLQEAIRKIATRGNPNDPEVRLRECMFEMGKALQAKNAKQLHHWGQQALQCTQRSGQPGLFATAHLVYAGMLFHFRDDERIGQLLHTALKISKQGASAGDRTCIPLYIQSCGYLGAHAQLRRHHNEALDWYLKQADVCMEHQFPQQAVTAYYLAAELSQRREKSRYAGILEQAYAAGRSLSDEEVRTSVFLYLLRSYYDVALDNADVPLCREIDTRMEPLMGVAWKEEVDRTKKERLPLMPASPVPLDEES